MQCHQNDAKSLDVIEMRDVIEKLCHKGTCFVTPDLTFFITNDYILFSLALSSCSQLSRGYMFILVPFLHYHFLRLRYCSRRNPSVRKGDVGREGKK